VVALTPERRAELLALLDDEQRLRADYPKVSEYLDAAPGLAGTGDIQGDAAFDLRVVHYVTGGQAVSTNPYWDVVAPSVSEHDGRRVVNGGNPEGSARLAFAQMMLQATYSYAIPAPETMEWVSAFCAGRQVVELGAGRGYWADQISRAGVEVRAFDSEPPDQVDNVSFPRSGKQEDVWYQVEKVVDLGSVFDGRTDRVLLLCWPPGWGNTMASEALAAFEKAGGTRLIFVGQPRGGMTGDDAFFDALSAGWKLESEDAQFVSWWNLLDVAQGWVRS
jgi:hypothetical protein